MNGLALLALMNSSVLLLKITLKCLLYHCGILRNNLGIISNGGVGNGANCCAYVIWEGFHCSALVTGSGWWGLTT